MGLREKFMVKQVYGDTDLSLKADVGKSILVKNIFIYNPASSYLSIKTALSTVGYFRVGGNLGNHLPMPIGSLKHSHDLILGTEATAETLKTYPITNALGVAAAINYNTVTGKVGTHANLLQFGAIPCNYYQTILALLESRGLFKGFPVAEGETIAFSGVKQALALQVVVYEEYDAGDIKKTDPNGSDATEYTFINYGRIAAAATTVGDKLYSVVQSPAEFPDFPYGKTVDPKSQVELLGILLSDAVDYRTSTDYVVTQYLKMLKGRVTLFDADKNGILVMGLIGTANVADQFARGLSLIGNFCDVDGKPPLFFDPPLLFESGEELGIYLTVAVGSSVSAASLPAADLEIGLIERVKLVA